MHISYQPFIIKHSSLDNWNHVPRVGLEVKIYDNFKKRNSIFGLLQRHGYMPKDGVRSQNLGHL